VTSLIPSGWWRLVAISLSFLLCGFTYRQAIPGKSFAFPDDHAAHKEFKTEWWYYTGHLFGQNGERFGYQLTFFRRGLKELTTKGSPVGVENLIFAHFALSDEGNKRFVFFEKINREGARAWADERAYDVWVEGWRVQLEGEVHHLRARQGAFAVDLRLTPLAKPVVHGRNGVSQKSVGLGKASHYYSVTRLETRGDLRVQERNLKVKGLSWMDHEFGSNQLTEDQVGWDWFSVQLGQGSDLMLFQIRKKDGTVEPESSGTLIHEDGRAEHLELKDFHLRQTGRWKSPKSGAFYPMGWRITIPKAMLEIDLDPSFPGQELNTGKSTRVIYWEGSVEARGSYQGKRVHGAGYVEMTGYAGAFDQKI
jgi:predicted secreted hydrolase